MVFRCNFIETAGGTLQIVVPQMNFFIFCYLSSSSKFLSEVDTATGSGTVVAVRQLILSSTALR